MICQIKLKRHLTVMLGRRDYELYIDAFTPESIPMARLAAYMASFAELLGNRDHVHFGQLKPGSLGVAARVDAIARPKVDKRLDAVRYGGSVSQNARKAQKDIDDKLAEDNAVGHILRGKTKIIEFPGRTRHVESKLGPIQQNATIDGEVIQIGGRDESINVHIKCDGEIQKCVTTKALARRLAPHIFGPPIRLVGTGTWARLESGVWELKGFDISDFQILDETPLSKLFEGLRSRLAPPEGGRTNPIDLMRQLREE